MAKRANKSTGLTNTNDPLSSMNLAQLFRKDNDIWLTVNKQMSDTYAMDELEQLDLLANLVKVRSNDFTTCLKYVFTQKRYKCILTIEKF